MNFYLHPEPFVNLRQLYWRLRSLRAYDSAARRMSYRRIRSERDRLAALGFSVEHLRLYCRYMSNPFSKCATLDRLQAFEAMLIDFSRIQFSAKLCTQKTGALPILL